jgi:hypothetical protein
MYFPQDLLFNCDKYDELRKTLFHKKHDLAKDPASPKLLGI